MELRIRLLVTGGAGFLGYYLVQAALACEQRSRGRRRSVSPCWTTSPWRARLARSLSAATISPSSRTTCASRCPGCAGLRLHHPCGRHRLADLLPQLPLETMDANVNGLRYLLDYACSGRRTRPVAKGSCSSRRSEIYGDPAPDAIPTPETYRGNVSCTGPRACYDESKRYGETLCVNFAQQYGRPGHDRAAVQQLRARAEDHRRPRDRRLRRAMCSPAATSSCSPTARRPGPSATSPMRSSATTRSLVSGRPGEPYNIGIEAPEISMRELAERVANAAASCAATRAR